MEIFSTLPLQDFFSPERIAALLRSAVLLLLGLPIILAFSRWARLYVSKKFSAQQGMIFGKIIKYTGFAIIAISVLNEMGFQLTHLFAAAGIAGIAIGFASQTSVSNIISGLFLIAERPFVVNDVITVGSTTGQVISIDFLSVKLRTFDNRFVRIPNETLIKSEVTNITHFPIRRLEINIGVAYKENVQRVREVLLDIAHKNPLCLMDPEPVVIFQGFGASSIDFFLGVWTAREDFLKLKNSIQEEIKARFDAEGIEIPFPHLSLYTGSATEPLPIKIVGDQVDPLHASDDHATPATRAAVG